MPVKCPFDFGNPILRNTNIVIDKRDKRGSRLHNSCVAAMRDALSWFKAVCQMRRSPQKFLNDLPGLICGIIVNDNNLATHVSGILIEDTFQRPGQQPAAVVCAEYGGNVVTMGH
jgi:hypothetical protein